jgi:5'(3')-deoxyribonucleotidase
MHKPTLFLDFDDVLVNTEPLTRRYVFERYGVRLPDGYVCGHSLHQLVNNALPITDQLDQHHFWLEHKAHFQMSRTWQRHLEPIPGADWVIQELAKTYTLWLVTARSQNGISLINEILDCLFPTAFTGIHCVWHYHRNGHFVERPKHEYMERVAPEQRVCFIDDHPTEIRHASSVLTSYLFDPNHWHTGATDIKHRVHSWEEIGALLLPVTQ